MSQDPFSLLEDLEEKARALKPGGRLDPKFVEPFLTVLARAVVSPESVEGPLMSYRLLAVQDALLARVAKLYGVPLHTLRYDLTVLVEEVQGERLDAIRSEEVAELEALYRLGEKGDAA